MPVAFIVNIAAGKATEERLKLPLAIVDVNENNVLNVSGLSLGIVHKTSSEIGEFWSAYQHYKTPNSVKPVDNGDLGNSPQCRRRSRYFHY
jgi:hypothetical protein